MLLLAQHFVTQFAAQAEKSVAGLSPQVAAKLLAYGWPGNVRELQNCIERAVTFARADALVVDDLPDHIRGHRSTQLDIPGIGPGDSISLDEVERRYVLRILKQTQGAKAAAADVFGVDRRMLHRMLERWRQDVDAV